MVRDKNLTRDEAEKLVAELQTVLKPNRVTAEEM